MTAIPRMTWPHDSMTWPHDRHPSHDLAEALAQHVACMRSYTGPGSTWRVDICSLPVGDVLWVAEDLQTGTR
jgi:hypothetical protein